MPIIRKIRIGNDTISRLEKAAAARCREATYLFEGGFHLSSIYLAGYAAEMTIGAAYFGTVRKYGRTQPIGKSERDRLIRDARTRSQVEDKSHPIDGLARYLIEERKAQGPPDLDGKIARILLDHVEQISEYWAPRLRYVPTEATKQQSRPILEATRWIIENCPRH
jgi:hypothetical protein